VREVGETVSRGTGTSKGRISVSPARDSCLREFYVEEKGSHEVKEPKNNTSEVLK